MQTKYEPHLQLVVQTMSCKQGSSIGSVREKIGIVWGVGAGKGMSGVYDS